MFAFMFVSTNTGWTLSYSGQARRWTCDFKLHRYVLSLWNLVFGEDKRLKPITTYVLWFHIIISVLGEEGRKVWNWDKTGQWEPEKSSEDLWQNVAPGKGWGPLRRLSWCRGAQEKPREVGSSRPRQLKASRGLKEKWSWRCWQRRPINEAIFDWEELSPNNFASDEIEWRLGPHPHSPPQPTGATRGWELTSVLTCPGILDAVSFLPEFQLPYLENRDKMSCA